MHLSTSIDKGVLAVSQEAQRDWLGFPVREETISTAWTDHHRWPPGIGLKLR